MIRSGSNVMLASLFLITLVSYHVRHNISFISFVKFNTPSTISYILWTSLILLWSYTYLLVRAQNKKAQIKAITTKFKRMWATKLAVHFPPVPDSIMLALFLILPFALYQQKVTLVAFIPFFLAVTFIFLKHALEAIQYLFLFYVPTWIGPFFGPFSDMFYAVYEKQNTEGRANMVMDWIKAEAVRNKDSEMLEVLESHHGFILVKDFPVIGEVRDIVTGKLYITDSMTKSPTLLRYWLLRRAYGQWVFGQRNWREKKFSYSAIKIKMSDFLMRKYRYIGHFYAFYEFLVLTAEFDVGPWPFERFITRNNVRVALSRDGNRLRKEVAIDDQNQSIVTIQEAKQIAQNMINSGKELTAERFARIVYFPMELAEAVLKEVRDNPETIMLLEEKKEEEGVKIYNGTAYTVLIYLLIVFGIMSVRWELWFRFVFGWLYP